MKRREFVLIICLTLLFVVGCNNTIKNTEPVKEKKSFSEATQQFIDNHKNNTFIEDAKSNNIPPSLGIFMTEEFFKKDLDEQYEVISDMYNEFNKIINAYDVGIYGSGHYDVMVGKKGQEYYSYIMSKDIFKLVSLDVGIKRENIEKGETNLKVYDKSKVLSGEYGGTKTNPLDSVSVGKNGFDWMEFSSDQKFKVVSDTLSSIKNDGFLINEGEYFFIEALDAFYSDDLTKEVPIPKALAQLGAMSGAITK